MGEQILIVNWYLYTSGSYIYIPVEALYSEMHMPLSYKALLNVTIFLEILSRNICLEILYIG